MAGGKHPYRQEGQSGSSHSTAVVDIMPSTLQLGIDSKHISQHLQFNLQLFLSLLPFL